MECFRTILIIPLLFVLPIAANGDNMAHEIQHLLEYVESTPCIYERNGINYAGREAVKHIKRKYDYFRKEIDSAEKFIELSATRSTVSGRYYMVYCKNEPAIRSQDWLLQELKRYRSRYRANTNQKVGISLKVG